MHLHVFWVKNTKHDNDIAKIQFLNASLIRTLLSNPKTTPFNMKLLFEDVDNIQKY